MNGGTWSENSAVTMLLNVEHEEGAKEIFSLPAEMPEKLFPGQVRRYFVRSFSEGPCEVLRQSPTPNTERRNCIFS